MLLSLLPLLAQVFVSNMNGQGWADAGLCLLGVKPLVDSWRVWKGEAPAKGQLWSNSIVLISTKMCEVIFESFPQGLLQTSAVLSAPLADLSLLRAISLASSFLARCWRTSRALLSASVGRLRMSRGQLSCGYVAMAP